MGTDDEAASYMKQLNKSMAALAKEAHAHLIREGCTSYVKTIYVGYDIDGEMVAALYGHANRIELALALPEDAEGAMLVDAAHLTWRTLPVAAVAKGPDDLTELSDLISLACSRVRSQKHTVMRDNDVFIKSRRNR